MQQLCSKFKNVNAHFWQSRMFIVRSKTWQNIIFFLVCWSCYKQRIHNVYLSKKQPSLKPSSESWLWHLDHVGGGKTSWKLWAKYVCFDENGSGSFVKFMGQICAPPWCKWSWNWLKIVVRTLCLCDWWNKACSWWNVTILGILQLLQKPITKV